MPRGKIDEKHLIDSKSVIKQVVDHKLPWCVWNKLYKKSVFEGITFPEGVVSAEDLVVALRTLLKADRIFIDNTPMYLYRRREYHTVWNSEIVNRMLKANEDIYKEVAKIHGDLFDLDEMLRMARKSFPIVMKSKQFKLHDKIGMVVLSFGVTPYKMYARILNGLKK